MSAKPTLEDVLATRGAALREVRPALLKQEPGVLHRWFQGPAGCDLFLWSREGTGLMQVQVAFDGRVVEWSEADGVRTGRLKSFDPRRPLRDLARLVLDASIDRETLQLCRAFLSAASVDDVTLALVRARLGVK